MHRAVNRALTISGAGFRINDCDSLKARRLRRIE
jgi:hypothetical protein